MFEIVIILLYKLRKDMNNLAQRYSIKHEIAYYECDINQQTPFKRRNKQLS